MKNLLFVLMQFVALLASATTTIHHPQYLALHVSGIEIAKVVTDDEATTLYFRCDGQPGARIMMDSECFLSDEQDRRYRAVSAKGIVLDSVFVYDKKGRGDFSISFEPLPKGTEVFDFVENLHKMSSFRFYMIHDKKADAALKERLQSRESPNYSFPAEAFHADSVVIRGRMSGKRVYGRLSRAYLHNLSLRMCDYGYARRYLPTITNVERDGTFEMKTSTMGPSWANIYYPDYGASCIPIFLWPGDTVDIDVEHFGESYQKIHYHSRHNECSRLLNLCFAEGGLFILFDAVDDLPEEQMVETRRRQLADNMLLSRYLADKYRFTPMEQTLMEYAFQMYAGQQLLWRLNERARQSGVFGPHGSIDDSRLAQVRAYNTRPVYDFLASMPNTNAMFAVPRCDYFFSALSNSTMLYDCNRATQRESPDGDILYFAEVDSLRADRIHRFRPDIPADEDLLIQMDTYNTLLRTTFFGDDLEEREKKQMNRVMARIHEPALRRMAEQNVRDRKYYRVHSTYALPQGRGKELLDSLLADFETPYVHVYFYNPSDTIHHRSNTQGIDTILAERPHAEDMSFLILCPAETCSEEDFDNFRFTHLYPYVRCHRLDNEHLFPLANLFQVEFQTQGFVLDQKRRYVTRVDMARAGWFSRDMDEVKRIVNGEM